MATKSKGSASTKEPRARAAEQSPGEPQTPVGSVGQIRGRLDGDELEQFVRLLRVVDTVELKLSVPDANRRSAVASLGMDPLDAQLRQVAFFDTPDLALDAAGVVVRARRVQGRTGDSVIKLRPIDPGSLPSAVRKSAAFSVEVDAMPTGYVCSGSMKAPADNALTREVMLGRRPIRKLFSKEQRALFASLVPDLQLDELCVLGPVNVLKLRFTPTDTDQRMVAELWFYPDGERILELSTKCLPNQAFDTAARARVYLAAHGIDLLAEQHTKTRTALDFFARELTAVG